LRTFAICHPWPTAALGARLSLSHLSSFRGPPQLRDTMIAKRPRRVGPQIAEHPTHQLEHNRHETLPIEQPEVDQRG
jgi:hypothetical protein